MNMYMLLLIYIYIIVIYVNIWAPIVFLMGGWPKSQGDDDHLQTDAADARQHFPWHGPLTILPVEHGDFP